MTALFEPVGWALVRAPLLPIEAYLSLPALPEDPRVGAAIAVASVSLFDAVEGSRPDTGSAAKLLRYLIRMSTRPTPFGLFAGVGIVDFASSTDVALGPGRPRTRTRPDMAWLLQLVQEQEERPEVRAQLRYLAHPGLSVHGGRVHLADPTVSLRATPVVRHALALAATPIEHRRLVADLVEASGAAFDRVEVMVEELWRQAVLLCDLRPPLTNADPARYVHRRLGSIVEAADACRRLGDAQAAMVAWDEGPLEGAGPAYRALAEGSPAQTDMALPLIGAAVNHEVGKEAARLADLLLRITPVPNGPPHLSAYRSAFLARYGADREVPLLELLDPVRGLGPPSAFRGVAAPTDPHRLARRHQTLLDLATGALRERRPVVELDQATVAALEIAAPVLGSVPLSLAISLFVLAPSAAELDAGRFQVVLGPNLGAMAAGKNLGRFADLLGDDAEAALHAVGDAESKLCPDAIWAEVVYHPSRPRSANVVIRAHCRRHEILFGTGPGVPRAGVIALDQLVVGVRSGRFRLRWPAAAAEVIPCAGHMLNNLQAPESCRFLDDLGRDGRAQFGPFDWGPAAGLPALPRVQAGRLILAPAQWRIDADRARTLAGPGYVAELSRWRVRWDVPRRVYLAFGDNRLLLDLDDAAQAAELHTEVRRLQPGGHLVVQEALPSPDDAWMPGPAGHFLSEFVVPLVRRAGPAPPPAAAAVLPAFEARDRVRLPGREWLFAKLYGPADWEDDVLCDRRSLRRPPHRRLVLRPLRRPAASLALPVARSPGSPDGGAAPTVLLGRGPGRRGAGQPVLCGHL